ncbi:uncharacterized protein LOC144920351 isoform X2 [Branchiostoma floridae x Branchiostoma belcheri]
MNCLFHACWCAVVLLHRPWLAQAVLLGEDELVAARLVVKPYDVIFDPFIQTQEVRLPCNSTGEQPVTYRWRKDGRLLDVNSRQPPYEMDAGALIIKNPEKSKDEGRYQCVAENDYGTVVSRRAALTFAYSDPFASTPRPPVSGRQGEGAALRCQKPEAYPGLMFFWVNSGSLDPAFTSTDQRVYVSQKTGDLYFALAERSDPGDYQCVVRLSVDVTSPLRHLSPTVSLSVTAQAQTPPQSAPNLVLHEGGSISSVTHATVLMEGFAYGNPIPTLTWRRLDAQGNEVPMPPADRRTMETWNRSLTISDVRREDAGFYEVTATNSLGSQSQRTQLVVNARPLFTKALSNQNHRLGLGESVTWDVAWDVGESTDPVDVIWLHNGEILTEGGRHRMTRSGNTASLQITDLTEEDSGAYQCSISNTYGRKRSSAELHSGAPSYVRNIRLVDSGDDYAVLAWDPPLGSDSDDIGGYQVQVIPKDGGDVRTVDVSPGETTARIDGLNTDSGGYTYRVRARSTRGTWGPWTTLGDDQGSVGSETRTAESTSQLLVWLLPLLFVLLLLLILLCCCCCLWLGLCGKYCPCCTCWTCFDRAESGSYKAMIMRRDHQEMLKLYRPDAVKHVQNPDKITAYLGSKNVRLPTGMSAIKKPHTREDHNKKLLDNLAFGDDDAFKGYCTVLRNEEKLYWLADTLEGPGLSGDLREQLMRHHAVLVEKMDPDITLAHLSKQKIFTDAMSDYVSSAVSREEKNRRILHLLQSRDDPSFYTFCGALRQNQRQAHLADLLKEEGLDLNKSVLLEEKSLDNATKAYSELDSKVYRQDIHNETHRYTHTTVTKTQLIKEMNQQNGAVEWRADSGVYRPREGAPIQRQLSLADPAIRSGASAVARRGQTVILEVNGEVDDAYWLLNGGSLPLNKGVHVRTYGLTHELTIDAMTSDLAGTYTCQGTTPDGAMLSCDIRITLLDHNPSL